MAQSRGVAQGSVPSSILNFFCAGYNRGNIRVSWLALYGTINEWQSCDRNTKHDEADGY